MNRGRRWLCAGTVLLALGQCKSQQLRKPLGEAAVTDGSRLALVDGVSASIRTDEDGNQRAYLNPADHKDYANWPAPEIRVVPEPTATDGMMVVGAEWDVYQEPRVVFEVKFCQSDDCLVQHTIANNAVFSAIPASWNEPKARIFVRQCIDEFPVKRCSLPGSATVTLANYNFGTGMAQRLKGFRLEQTLLDTRARHLCGMLASCRTSFEELPAKDRILDAQHFHNARVAGCYATAFGVDAMADQAVTGVFSQAQDTTDDAPEPQGLALANTDNPTTTKRNPTHLYQDEIPALSAKYAKYDFEGKFIAALTGRYRQCGRIRLFVDGRFIDRAGAFHRRDVLVSCVINKIPGEAQRDYEQALRDNAWYHYGSKAGYLIGGGVAIGAVALYSPRARIALFGAMSAMWAMTAVLDDDWVGAFMRMTVALSDAYAAFMEYRGMQYSEAEIKRLTVQLDDLKRKGLIDADGKVTSQGKIQLRTNEGDLTFGTNNNYKVGDKSVTQRNLEMHKRSLSMISGSTAAIAGLVGVGTVGVTYVLAARHREEEKKRHGLKLAEADPSLPGNACITNALNVMGDEVEDLLTAFR